MALIQCTECGQQVSDKAAACPKCGAPIRDATTATVQQTSKKWKAMQLFAVIGIMAGVVSCMSGMSDIQSAPPNADPPMGGVIAGLLFMVSVPLYICARIGAWWYHK